MNQLNCKTPEELSYSYKVVEKLENEINKQREETSGLIKMLDKFINVYYKGCSKEEYNQLRIEAEKLIKQ